MLINFKATQMWVCDHLHVLSYSDHSNNRQQWPFLSLSSVSLRGIWKEILLIYFAEPCVSTLIPPTFILYWVSWYTNFCSPVLGFHTRRQSVLDDARAFNISSELCQCPPQSSLLWRITYLLAQLITLMAEHQWLMAVLSIPQTAVILSKCHLCFLISNFC